jgi:phosphoribosylaminoimidazolecarboxamide formyltransferase / IMP cyclohydrolase
MSQSPIITRALLSVSDKTDLIPFATALSAMKIEIISTGGTARALQEAGIKVTPVDQVTGFPEIMDGRVKTLHPKIHGALLGVRDNPDHARAMSEHDIAPIDLVCVNLYPFERTVSSPGVEQAEAIEQIDIGGPSMIRSAAKNFASVTVVTSASQYDRVIEDLKSNDGATTPALRASLAASAFARTCEYDAAIASYLSRRGPEPFPEVLDLRYTRASQLRYGENPHQDASLYRDPASTGPTIVNAQKLHGKDLSYNNILDASAALEMAKAMRKLDPDRIGACVVKHTNPCGAATSWSCRNAIDLAFAGDPLAAYGGILAVNRAIDEEGADRICEDGVFLEVIAAPQFEEAALAKLKARWKNVRLLAVGDRPGSTARKIDFRSIPGGMLVQDRDTPTPNPGDWKHAAGPAPSAESCAAAAMLVCVVRAVSSNAIVIGGPTEFGTRVFGTGSGQMDRVASSRIAIEKAGPLTQGAIVASDAFFPFADGPRLLADAGVSMIVHPGGSKRDQETFDVCNECGITCMTTSVRHFRH